MAHQASGTATTAKTRKKGDPTLSAFMAGCGTR
jgi:hypothetical protein